MGIELKIKKKYADFSLDVEIKSESKRIGILGASGCGKTLTLKAIAGLIRPDEGSITFDGKVLYDSSKKIDIKAKKELFIHQAMSRHSGLLRI